MNNKILLNILLIAVISIFTGCGGGSLANFTDTPLEKKFAKKDLKSTIQYLSTQDVKKLTYGNIKKNILQLALHKKFLPLANHIIDNNLVDVNYVDLTGRNALFEAVLYPNIVKKLLEKGIDTKLKTKNGVTALHVAIASSTTNKNIIKMLLDSGSDINAKSSDNLTAINYALYKNRTDIINLLLDYNINLNNNKLILHHIANNNDLATMKRIIDKGFSVNNKNAQNLTPLGLIMTNLVKHNKETTPEILTLLIKNGAELNVTIYGGGQYGNIKSILTKDDFVILFIRKNYQEILKYFLDNNLDLNKRDKYGFFPLSYAMDKDNIEIMKMLLKKGLDINVLNKNGETYLHGAMGRGSLEMVKLLVNQKIKVFFKDQEDSPLFIGYGLKEYPETIKYLVENGANLNDTNYSGYSLLTYAIDQKHIELAKYLINKGTDIHIVNSSGSSLLHFAVWSNLPEIAKMLIQKGINKNIKNKRGYTVFQLGKNSENFKQLGIF